MTPWTELTFAAAFLVGLTGSLHCASMCGPLLGILCASREKNTSGTVRLVRATTYHAGRIASYAIGGALAGSLGSVGLVLRAGPSAQHVVLFATSAMLLLLAAYIAGRAGFRLVGVMAYEAQVAGVATRPPGRPLDGAVNRWMQSRSMPELRRRRAAAVAEVRRHADLEFVNGGGTGSLEATSADPAG